MRVATQARRRFRGNFAAPVTGAVKKGYLTVGRSGLETSYVRPG